MRTRINLKPDLNHLIILFPYTETIDAVANAKAGGCMPGILGEYDLYDGRKQRTNCEI